MKNKRIFIVSGGTGGHIIPALAVFEMLNKKEFEVFFIARKKDLKIVQQLNSIKEKIIFIPARGFKRKISLYNFVTLLYLIISTIISFFILVYYNPELVLTFGGYITFPILFNCLILRKDFIIFEQNSYPGLVNRIFQRWAKNVFVNFEYTKKYLKKSEVIGNPLRESVRKKISKKECLKFFGFTKNRFTILVTGGSQGALKINEAFSKIINKLEKFNIIWITGKMHYDRFKDYSKKGRIFITPYLLNMEFAYNISNMAICRAGALTLTELAYWGIPALLIPLPVSAENHQLLNAKILERKNSAVLLEEKYLNEENLLKGIEKIIKNYKIMQNRIKSFYIEDCLNRVLNYIERIFIE